MSEVKHTPGPWTEKSGDIYDSESKPIARMLFGRGGWSRDSDDVWANARLIAAAPEMYSLIEELEWAGEEEIEDNGRESACPWCGALQSDGKHFATCIIAATLRNARGEAA